MCEKRDKTKNKTFADWIINEFQLEWIEFSECLEMMSSSLGQKNNLIYRKSNSRLRLRCTFPMILITSWILSFETKSSSFCSTRNWEEELVKIMMTTCCDRCCLLFILLPKQSDIFSFNTIPLSNRMFCEKVSWGHRKKINADYVFSLLMNCFEFPIRYRWCFNIFKDIIYVITTVSLIHFLLM